MKISLKFLSLFLAFTMFSCGGKEEASEEKNGSAGAEGFEDLLASAYNSMENPMLVLSVDLENLQNKSDLENTLKKQLGDDYAQAEQGINMFKGMIKKIHVVASVTEFDPEMSDDPKGNAIILAKIEDTEKFSTAMGMANAMMPDVDEINGFKLKDLGGQAVLGYTDNMVILAADAEGKAMKIMEGALNGGNTEIGELLANSVNSSSDISCYMDMGNLMSVYGDIMKNMKDNPAMEGVDMSMMDDYMGKYKGSSMLMEVNFENGKLVTKLTNDFVDKAGDEFNMLADAGLSADVLGKAANSPIGMFSMNLQWQKLWAMAKPFISEKQMAEINDGMTESGMTFADVMEIFNGQFAFAYNGQIENTPTPKIGMYIGMTDPSKIKELVESKGKATKDADGVYSKDEMSMYFGENFMLINSDKAFISGVAGGANGEVNLGDQSNILNSPINYYLDFKALMANDIVKAAISQASPEAVEAMDMLDKLYGNGTVSTFEYVLETKDKSSNILLQIIDAITKSMNAQNEAVAAEMAELEEEFEN